MRLRHAAKILIRRRSDQKYLILWSSEWEENPRRSHQPDLPGGIVEEGESLKIGLLREVQEEVGLDLSDAKLTLAYALTFDKENDESTVFLIYFAEIDDHTEVTLSWEHEAFKWLTAAEVRELDIRMPYPMIFEHMAETNLLV